jgi:hypothetical protein
MKDPPEPGVLFPSLKTRNDDAEVEKNDDLIFQQVAASLSPSQK